MKHKDSTTIIIRFILTVFWSVGAFSCVAQKDIVVLSNTEVNEVLDKIDTSIGDGNYHVLLKSEDSETFQVYIWINDRLGETMFEEAGMNVCRLYNFKQSLVFVYEYRQCYHNISPKFLRDKSPDPYAYLTESPFYVENGFRRAFLVKRVGPSLKLTKLELVDNVDQDVKELIEQ